MKLKAPWFLPSTPMFCHLRLFSSFKACLDGIETTTCVAVNTFEELEDSLVYLSLGWIPIFSVARFSSHFHFLLFNPGFRILYGYKWLYLLNHFVLLLIRFYIYARQRSGVVASVWREDVYIECLVYLVSLKVTPCLTKTSKDNVNMF